MKIISQNMLFVLFKIFITINLHRDCISLCPTALPDHDMETIHSDMTAVDSDAGSVDSVAKWSDFRLLDLRL